MGRLNQSTGGKSGGIGRPGLIALANEMNAERERLGVPERYGIEEVNGVLTLTAPRRPRTVDLVNVARIHPKLPSAFG